MHGNSKIARMGKLRSTACMVEWYSTLVQTKPQYQKDLDYWQAQYAKAFKRVYGVNPPQN